MGPYNDLFRLDISDVQHIRRSGDLHETETIITVKFRGLDLVKVLRLSSTFKYLNDVYLTFQ